MFARLLLIVLCILRAANSITTHSDTNPLRIIGGTDAGAEWSQADSATCLKYPYVVRVEELIQIVFGEKSIQYRTSVCTGATITPLWTLTAAHCVFIPEAGHLAIAYGSKSSRDENTKFAQIHEYRQHPAYKLREYDEVGMTTLHDIALAKTDPVLVPKYGRISSIDIMSLVGQEALALGYGIMDTTVKGETIVTNTLLLNKPLQALRVMIMRCPNDNNDILAYRSYPTICATGKCNQIVSTAGGDSGGPLLHESGIVGVLSLGLDFDYENLQLISEPVGEYTATSSVLDWIADAIDLRNKNV